jgi:alpha-mannosidase
MKESNLWAITTPDLVNNYGNPNMLGDVTWRVPPREAEKGPVSWPLFHPSEADSDSGYRRHPYVVEFEVVGVPEAQYLLRIEYLVIAARLAYLEMNLNGVLGFAYFRPRPSQSGKIVLQMGLHAAIYSDGVAEIAVPGELLRPGLNRLELVARDDGEVIRVDRIEAIKRLDRAANGAGFIYQGLAFGGASDARREHRVELEASPFYKRTGDGLLVELVHAYVELGGSFAGGTLTVEAGAFRTELAAPAAEFGHLNLNFELPDGPEAELPYRVFGAGLDQSGTLTRAKKWQVYVTPHAHTDIGYTHRQWEVAERLCRNIDYALEMLAAGNGDSFSYHLDASWALETYLATRSPERRKQFFEAVRAGKIGVAAGYADLLTQFAALEDLIRNQETTELMLRPEGVKTDFTAVVDVASLTWAYPAVLGQAGVKYLVHANNQDRGPFRLNGGLHKVSPFWWEGPGGGRILVWLSKMYCELRKVCGSPPVLDSALTGLELWLQEFTHESYAPDAVLMYGQEADNTDMDPQPVDFVRQWNAQYEYPKLIPSDVSSFFRYVEAHFGDRLAVYKGDSGAYWEDGVLSSIIPSIAVREAQAALPAAEKLESLAVLHRPDWAFPADQFDEAWRQVLLYDEHTWGAFLSATEPDALLAHDQWEVKKGFAEQGHSWAKRLLHVAAARHTLNWNNDGREVVVYNPHSWTVSGPIQVEVEPGEVPVDPETGAELPFRRVKVLSSQATVEVWVEKLPGLSYRRLVLARNQETAGQSLTKVFEESAAVLENQHYRLVIDPARGAVTSWVDKALGRDLVDPGSPWLFGQMLYARGGEGTRLLGNSASLPEGDPEILTAFTPGSVTVERWAYGQRVVLTGVVPMGEIELEWTLPDQAKRVELKCVYRKEATKSKEAVYIAFPTSLGKGAKVESDSHLGWVNWDKDQLPGGCKEWLPVQSGILVTGGGAAVHIATPDIPLFCVNDVVRGRWPKELDLTGGTVLSYVLNNYWHTNYLGLQGGEITFRYHLTSGTEIEKAEAYRRGWEARRPLYGHRMSFQDFRTVQAPYEEAAGGTLAVVGNEHVVLSTMRPARWSAGFLVRLQETAGIDGNAPVAIVGRRIAQAFITDLLERTETPFPVAPDGTLANVPVQAWGLTTIRIELEAGATA